MFVSNASDLIRTKDPNAADLFIKEHRPLGIVSLAVLQDTFDDLAQWNFQVLPYIQGIPMRIRAMVLEDQVLRRICE
jgi:hypothetical protein